MVRHETVSISLQTAHLLLRACQLLPGSAMPSGQDKLLLGSAQNELEQAIQLAARQNQETPAPAPILE